MASRRASPNLALWYSGSGSMRAGIDSPEVFSLALSHDGKALAAGCRNRVVLFDAASMHPMNTIDADGRAGLMAFTPDSSTLATVTRSTIDSNDFGGTVRLWNASTGDLSRTIQAHPVAIRAIAFSPNGRILATAAGRLAISEFKLWDVASGKLLVELEGRTSTVHCAAFSPDGTTLAAGCEDGTVRLWNVLSGPAGETSVIAH